MSNISMRELSREYPPRMKVLLHDIVSKYERNADVYLLNGRANRYADNSRGQVLRIFLFSSPSSTTGMETLDSMKYKDRTIEFEEPIRKMPKATRQISGIEPIYDDLGQQVAFFDRIHKSLYITFDVIDSRIEQDIQTELFDMAMSIYDEKFLSEERDRTSWAKTKDKDSLTEVFVKRIKQQAETDAHQDRERIAENERSIHDYMTRTKSYYDQIIKLRNKAESAEKYAREAGDKLLKDLDLIISSPNYEDVRIDNGEITLITNEVYAYTKHDDRYHVGKYHIKVNMQSTDIRFSSSIQRRSYWSNEDFHPHIEKNGRACFGNVSSSIAELCSQSELYALSMVLMDYLENINLEDIAGRHCINWDQVDDEGNIIKKGRINARPGDDEDDEDIQCDCNRCGGGILESEEYFNVYTAHDGEGGLSEEEVWCESCREYSGIFQEDVDEVVHESIYDEIEEYYDNERASSLD